MAPALCANRAPVPHQQTIGARPRRPPGYADVGGSLAAARCMPRGRANGLAPLFASIARRSRRRPARTDRAESLVLPALLRTLWCRLYGGAQVEGASPVVHIGPDPWHIVGVKNLAT
jgi:hypothetical protein